MYCRWPISSKVCKAANKPEKRHPVVDFDAIDCPAFQT